MSKTTDQSQILQAIVETIIQQANPERVILFGSRAKGTAQSESDYDFLVIVRDVQNEREISRRIYRALEKKGCAIRATITPSVRTNTIGPWNWQSGS